MSPVAGPVVSSNRFAILARRALTDVRVSAS